MLAALVLTGMAALPALAWAAGTERDRCLTPMELVTAPAPLPHLAAAVASHRLNVLVVGSATVLGPEASLRAGTVTRQMLSGGSPAPVPPTGEVVSGAPETAFPMQMAKVLRERISGLAVEVTVFGGRSLSATDMLALLRRELPRKLYQLVIWQTGTIEAVRNVPAGDFFQTLTDGAALVQDANADLVLVDQQYSRFLHANANLDPYLQSMQQIAATPGALLFRRMEIMRNWVNEGQIDLERTPKAERPATVSLLHACLGQQLARLVRSAARP